MPPRATTEPKTQVLGILLLWTPDYFRRLKKLFAKEDPVIAFDCASIKLNITDVRIHRLAFTH
jgi:hypothetical protein